MTDVTKSKPRGLSGLVQRGAGAILGEFSTFTVETIRLPKAMLPVLQLVASDTEIDHAQLTRALDRTFEGLYRHPVQIPEPLIRDFWDFFDELMRTPELKGLGELSLDMLRLVLRSYEPLLLEIINLLKAGKRFNQWQINELMQRAAVVRKDVAIIRRQLRALRHIRPFFQTDTQDFRAQAQIVAAMVREFGPFFVKMAQVAAANADFLPEEIARELAVFHEDVPPMTAPEVIDAFAECHGKHPKEIYIGFDAERPLRSGSIGSVYLAKRSIKSGDREILAPVLIKVGRHNIDREFVLGKLVLGLAIMSSQYWAPHSKLAPFLKAWQDQVEEFTTGFEQELDFNREARNQVRFHQRSQKSSLWGVPALYGASRRILEMELISDAQSLAEAQRSVPRWRRRVWQHRTAERLFYTLAYQLLVYGECHGDLHPGNIMIDTRGDLYLIDWGNAVNLQGMWSVVGRYLTGVLLADTRILADALIEISTHPEENQSRRAEIKAALDETLNRKGVTPLRGPLMGLQLLREGGAGVHRRLQAALHLLTNTQQLGVVPRGEYMHLLRSALAAAGSFGTLYEDTQSRTLALDMLAFTARFPLRAVQDMAQSRLRGARERAWQAMPLPDYMRQPEPEPEALLEVPEENEIPALQLFAPAVA